jgi:xylulokinase
MPNYILAHDLGTTGNKANIFDEQGSLIISDFVGYETAYPRSGWAEQDALDWWAAVARSTKRLLERPSITAKDIAAISFSAQMMACLPVDSEGVPLRQAIIWADQRATTEADQLSARYGEQAIYRATGHRVSAAYTGPKILWIKQHEPEVYRATHLFLQAKEYVAHRLTGAFATDYSDASGTNLFNLDARRWDGDILEAAEIEPNLLPEAYPSHQIIGQVTPEAAEPTGLLAGTPVVIGGGDGACATVGAGVVDKGDAYNYIGSSSWIAVASPEPIYDPQRRIFNFAHLDPSLVCPMGTMQTAGGAYTWLANLLDCPDEPERYRLIDEMAAQTPVGAEGLLFLPYLMGERSPYWDSLARGAFVGLSMKHSAGHAARAVLEGVGFNLRMILDALTDQGLDLTALRLIGGGAQSPLWRQILADVFDLPILRPHLLAEATSLGAAVAGGVGVGLWRDYQVIQDFVEITPAEKPEPQAQALYDQLYPLFQEAYQQLTAVNAQLAQIQAG